MTESASSTVVPGRGKSTLTKRVDATDLIAEVIWSRVYQRNQQAVGQALEIAKNIVAALRREGLITGTRAVNSDEIINSVQQYAGQFGEAPKRGISHLVAEALVLLNLPAVHRDVVYSLLPDIDTGTAKRTVEMQFKRALRKFNGWKWINRREDGIIEILDRDALVKWFTVAEDVNAYRAATTLNIAGAIAQLHREVEAGVVDELRRRELLAMRQVMESAPGAVTNQRGSVRVIPKSTPL